MASPRAISASAWQATRLNARYHTVLRLAEIVLRATSVEHGSGEAEHRPRSSMPSTRRRSQPDTGTRISINCARTAPYVICITGPARYSPNSRTQILLASASSTGATPSGTWSSARCCPPCHDRARRHRRSASYVSAGSRPETAPGRAHARPSISVKIIFASSFVSSGISSLCRSEQLYQLELEAGQWRPVSLVPAPSTVARTRVRAWVLR
jgi:hypothetical protein